MSPNTFSFRTIASGAAILVLCGLAASLLVQADSQAQTIDTSILLANAPPFVSSVRLSNSAFGSEEYSGGINSLVPGGTKTIYLNGIVQDNNSGDEIDHVDSVFYRSGVAGVGGCVENDGNDCYKVFDCELSSDGVTSLQRRYSCPLDLWYFADSTVAGGEFPGDHWVASVTVFDRAGAHATNASLAREIQTLLALHVPGSVNYGILSVGESTDEANEFAHVISQEGNDESDVEVSYSTAPGAPGYGGTMDCVHNGGIGAVPSGRQQWSVVPNHYGGPGSVSLTAVPAVVPLGVGYRHGATVPSEPVYWNISIPDSGVSGTCTGSVTISAVSH